MRIPGNPLFDSKVTGIEPSHLSPVSVAMMPGSQLPATPPPPRDIRRQIGVPQHVFARILGVSPRTLADYEAGGEPSETARRRLIEVSRLFQAMGAMVPLDTLGPWLQKPNDTFCGLTPVQVIDRGEIDRLWTMVAMLEAGVAG
jgi:DNA-binding transcriptional regulator YiaG